MPAQIIHIPMCFGNDRPFVPPPPDPRDPVVRERFTPPTDEEWRRLDGCEVINRLMDEHGAKRVATWVRNLAAMRGEAI